MNYVKHLNSVCVRFYDDARLHTGHISLYLALFFYWNLHRFPEEFYANRKELMHMGKIGSKSTYHRLLHELHDWDYIQYRPSHNPKQHSTVVLSQHWDKSGTLTGRTRTLFRTYCPMGVPASLYTKPYKQHKRSLGAQPKSQLEVLDFFKEKKYVLEEASKFFNHYQAIGWKIGGKVPITDWKAAADNWMLKAAAIKAKEAAGRQVLFQKLANTTDHLITTNEKNYGEPL